MTGEYGGLCIQAAVLASMRGCASHTRSMGVGVPGVESVPQTQGLDLDTGPNTEPAPTDPEGQHFVEDYAV